MVFGLEIEDRLGVVVEEELLFAVGVGLDPAS